MSFGLQGTKNPQKIVLEMCPHVKASCCVVQDQIKIYKRWVGSGEKEDFLQRFNFYYKVYNDFLDLISEANQKANGMLKLMKDQKVTNCKLFAMKISQF